MISAVFGGFDIDLRKADMAGDSVVLRVDVVFGGCEIKIPESWYAEYMARRSSAASPTRRGIRRRGPGTKQFIVKGGAVFGGVVVKN